MRPDLTTTCRVFTTPSQLRKIADLMESFWKDVRCGQSTKVFTIYGGSLEVDFHVDQDAISREKV